MFTASTIGVLEIQRLRESATAERIADQLDVREYQAILADTAAALRQAHSNKRLTARARCAQRLNARASKEQH